MKKSILKLWTVFSLLECLSFAGKLFLVPFIYIFVFFILVRLDFLYINVFLIGVVEKLKNIHKLLIFIPAIVFVLPICSRIKSYGVKIINNLITWQLKTLENLLLLVLSPIVSIVICHYLFEGANIWDFSAFVAFVFSFLFCLHVSKTCAFEEETKIIRSSGEYDGSKVLKIMPDTPTDDIEKCSYGRRYFIEQLTSSLKAQGKDNIIYGLHGKWGEGKTSILMMLEKHTQDAFIFMFFSPNFYHSEEAMIYGFYEELENKLKEYFVIDRAFEKILSQYIKHLISNHNNSFIRGLREFFMEGKSPEKLKDAIEEHIEMSGKQLIIVVDDFDRLNKDEVQAVFKIVRNNSNFRNTKYIICYDPVTLEAVLADTDFPNDFLNKLVQVPVQIPKADYYELRDFIVKECPECKAELDKFAGRDFELLGNFRNAKRFVGLIKTLYLSMEHEMNFLDFFWVSILKITNLKLYEQIRTDKEFYCFINVRPDGMTRAEIDQKFQKEKKRIEEFLEEDNNIKSVELIEKYINIVLILFHRIIRDDFVEKPISSLKYFDNYFFINKDLINDSDVNEYLGQTFRDKEFARRALEKLYLEKSKPLYKEFLKVFERASQSIKAIHAEGLFMFILDNEAFLSGDESQARIEFDLLEVLLFSQGVDKRVLFMAMLKKTKKKYYVCIVDILDIGNEDSVNIELIGLFLKKLQKEYLDSNENIFETGKTARDVEDLIYFWLDSSLNLLGGDVVKRINTYLYNLIHISNGNREQLFILINNLLKRKSLIRLSKLFLFDVYLDIVDLDKKEEKMFVSVLNLELFHNFNHWYEKLLKQIPFWVSADEISDAFLKEILKWLAPWARDRHGEWHKEFVNPIREPIKKLLGGGVVVNRFQTINEIYIACCNLREGVDESNGFFEGDVLALSKFIGTLKKHLEYSEHLSRLMLSEVGEFYMPKNNKSNISDLHKKMNRIEQVLMSYVDRFIETRYEKLVVEFGNVKDFSYNRSKDSD